MLSRKHLRQTRLVEWDVTAVEFGDLARVDVDADDLVPKFRHSGGVGCAQVARAEDGASHRAYVGRRSELIATPH